MVYSFGKPCNSSSKNASDPNYECNPITGRWNKKKRSIVKPRRSIVKPRRSIVKPRRSVVKPQKGGCNPNLKNANDPNYECNQLTGRWNKKKRSIVKPRRRSIVKPRRRSIVKPRKRSIVKPRRRDCNPNLKNASDPNYECNPLTGRWNKKIRGIVKPYGPLKKDCFPDWHATDPYYVCDHNDGNWVNKYSVRGQILYPITCDLPVEGVDNYDKIELLDRLEKCGYEDMNYNKEQLYNIINWNRIKKCENEYTFMGDPVNEVPHEKIIRINGACYDIDDVFQYLITNKMKNVDPYNTSNKLWTDVNTYNNIIYHYGADYNLIVKLEKIIDDISVELSKIVRTVDADNIIHDMFVAGWVCISDNPFSYSENEPEKFHFSQIVLSNLIDLVNSSEDKDSWLEYQNPSGINLNSIFGTLSSSCIHGVGFKLLGHASFLYYKALDDGNNIRLPEIILGTDPINRITTTFEVTTPNGIVDPITIDSSLKGVYMVDGNADRNFTTITDDKQAIVDSANKIKESLNNNLDYNG